MDTVVDWLLVGVGVVLTLGTAIFVIAEFSFVAVDPSKVARCAKNGDKKAQAVQKALKNLSLQLSGTQVGITLTTILLGYTTQNALGRLLEKGLAYTSLSTAVSVAIAAVIALLITNVFSMVFGELVPKNLSLADPLRAASLVVRFQNGFTTLFKPIVKMLNGVANAILRGFGVEVFEELSGARSAQELVALVRRSADQGTLDSSTASIFTRSINMAELSAIDVMTDRGRVHYLESTKTAADIVALAHSTGHSRFPVVGENLDDIEGFVSLRAALSVPYERRGEVLVLSQPLLVEVARVPETMELGPLLVLLRDAPLQVAVVLDEYGGTSGIVTLEDAVEEIVGEVADEHDSRRRGVRHIGPGAWLVSGLLRPDELAHQTRITLPEDGPYETLGGLVMTSLGRVPVVGDCVRVDKWRLEVERMDGRRVDFLRIEPYRTHNTQSSSAVSKETK